MKLLIFCILLALTVGIAISCRGNNTNTNEAPKVSLQSTNPPVQPKVDPVLEAYMNGVRVGVTLARRNQDIDADSAVAIAIRYMQKR